jgi:transposase
VGFKTIPWTTEYVHCRFRDNETGETVYVDKDACEKPKVIYSIVFYAFALYLRVWQIIPFNRVSETMLVLMGKKVSTGTLAKMVSRLANSKVVDNYRKAAAKNLINCLRMFVDESGGNCGGKTCWIHVWMNETFVYFFFHQKRGKEAMEDGGILPFFRGFLQSDCWGPYSSLEVLSALCGAHLLRELEHAIQCEYSWAVDMKAHLLQLKEMCEQNEGVLPEDRRDWARQRYLEIIAAGDVETQARNLPAPPEDPNGKKKRGRVKNAKTRNLLMRMWKRMFDVLRFSENGMVEFTNNRAEKAVRMMKVYFKVCGCFRTEEAARDFCTIRGYLLSCQQNGIAPYEAIKMALEDVTPDFITEAL